MKDGRVRLGLGDLDRLNRALDLAGSAEDAVLLPCRVSLPCSQGGFAAVVRDTVVHLRLFTLKLHTVENVDWADCDADSVGDADVKVDSYCGSVDSILFAGSLFPFDLMVDVGFLVRPAVRETRIFD